jgi:hypothetical protein
MSSYQSLVLSKLANADGTLFRQIESRAIAPKGSFADAGASHNQAAFVVSSLQYP